MNSFAVQPQANPARPLCETGAEPAALGAMWELEVAQEMVSAMDTLTFGGQRYVMEKIVALLGDLLADGRGGQSRRNRDAMREQLLHLTRLARRDYPDARAFADRAGALLRLMAAVP